MQSLGTQFHDGKNVYFRALGLIREFTAHSARAAIASKTKPKDAPLDVILAHVGVHQKLLESFMINLLLKKMLRHVLFCPGSLFLDN